VALKLLEWRSEAHVSKRTWGILAGLMGSALSAWFVARRNAAARRQLTPAREHGTVIYDNTPSAADIDAII
jgi:hypothetical protein